MSLSEIYLVVPSPVLSGLIWLFALTAVLYFARLPAKKYILAFSEVIDKKRQPFSGCLFLCHKI